MRESIKMKTDDFNFKFRVSGVIIKDNKLLVVDMDDSGFLCLPSGYVELGETTEEAVKRELNEEICKNFEVKEYLGVIENYFINKFSKKMHEISFYYLVDTEEFTDYENFTLIENDKGNKVKLDFRWIDLNDINSYDVRPKFLKNILNSNNIVFGHLICNEIDQMYQRLK